MTASTLQPHQQRVVEELQQLKDRIEKLGAFLAGQTVAILDDRELMLMVTQKNAMDTYAMVLAMRLALWTEPR